MRVLILDGYNVIHAIPELERALDRSLEAAREALIGRCCAYQANRGDAQEIYIVFDGRETDDQAPTKRGPRVTVLFTPRKEEADDRILRLIKDAKGRTEFVIVSNDTYVFNNARAHGARAAASAIAEAIHRGDSDRSARALYDLLQGEVVGTGQPLEA